MLLFMRPRGDALILHFLHIHDSCIVRRSKKKKEEDHCTKVWMYKSGLCKKMYYWLISAYLTEKQNVQHRNDCDLYIFFQAPFRHSRKTEMCILYTVVVPRLYRCFLTVEREQRTLIIKTFHYYCISSRKPKPDTHSQNVDLARLWHLA